MTSDNVDGAAAFAGGVAPLTPIEPSTESDPTFSAIVWLEAVAFATA